MLENFVVKHKIVSGLIVILIAIGLLVLLISSIVNKTTVVDPQATNTGVDSSGENTSLPYSNDLFSISSVKDNIINIDAPEQFRNAAIQQLYDSGIDPTNYKIKFNYESPFKTYE